MLHCLFYSIFFSLFLNLSIGSLRFSQINRTFLSSFKGVYEASVVTVGSDGEPIYPYFYKPVLENYIYEFIAKNIEKFTTSYDLSLSYYKLDGITICGENDLPRCVNVSLRAEINYLFKYSNQQQISIKEREKL